MAHRRKSAFTCAILALICGGCTTEKAPPTVMWLSPQSTVHLQEGDALGLKFSISDPAPERGTTEAASWRVTIGTEAGVTWWTTSGNVSAAPALDTIETTWQVPAAPAGSAGSTALLLSAICTDGEGQTGADFGTLTLTSTPLASLGLWWAEGPSEYGFGFADPQVNTLPETYPGPGVPHQMVHLDGQDLIVSGTTEAQGWPLSNGIPSTEPAWSVVPSATTTGQIRFVRRAPFEYTGASWAAVGWSDRCTWLDANGLTMKTWLLNPDEQLIDACVAAGQMVLLARTNANDLRMIRFNVDNAARLESVTWTPQAAGSAGPNGNAWLILKQDLPAALEADGTLRLWGSNGGATPLSTLDFPGSGAVIRAGQLTEGGSWAERDESLFCANDLSHLGTWNGAIYHVTIDRTSGNFWLLSGSDNERLWWALEPSFDPIGDPIPAGTGTTTGCIAHNRPGPL